MEARETLAELATDRLREEGVNVERVETFLDRIVPDVLQAEAEQPAHNEVPVPAPHVPDAVDPVAHALPEGLVDVDLFDLSDWLDPVVPEPSHLPVPNNNSLCVFDTLGAWECALSRFTTSTDIPRPFRSKWAHVYDDVLHNWERAMTNLDTNGITQALKGFLILPQLLLRQGGRGGKRGQAGLGLAARFDLAVLGEWQTLVQLWQADLIRLEDKESRRNQGRRAADDDKLREEVLRKPNL